MGRILLGFPSVQCTPALANKIIKIHKNYGKKHTNESRKIFFMHTLTLGTHIMPSLVHIANKDWLCMERYDMNDRVRFRRFIFLNN